MGKTKFHGGSMVALVVAGLLGLGSFSTQSAIHEIEAILFLILAAILSAAGMVQERLEAKAAAPPENAKQRLQRLDPDLAARMK